MPSKKRSSKSASTAGGLSDAPWQVILEEIKSQNRATIEAVESRADALERKIDDGMRESRERDAMLAAAIQSLRVDLKTDIAHADARIDKIGMLDERVAALERRR
jgi:hypothetical protein